MQRTRFLAAVLVAPVVLAAFGCIRGERESLGVTTAAGAGQVGSVTSSESRRQRISLRALGRMLEKAQRETAGQQPAGDSAAVIR